jgi:hypothetical protein
MPVLTAVVISRVTTHRVQSADIALAKSRGAVAGNPFGTFRIWTDK